MSTISQHKLYQRDKTSELEITFMAALNDADRRLLRAVTTIESNLPTQIDVERFSDSVTKLEALTTQAQHDGLVQRAHNLIALLSPNPGFPAVIRAFTARDPAFMVPLAAAASEGRSVSGAPLGVWVGELHPGLASRAWMLAERELKDLVGLTASGIVPDAKAGPLTLPYRPLAKARGLQNVIRTDLPAVVVKPLPRELRAAADAASRELEPYARALESFEELSYAIRAAQLPKALFEFWMQQAEGARLSQCVHQLRIHSPLDMQQILAALLPDVQAPDRRHISVVSELLARFGIGFEPDPKFLAALAHPTTTVSFFDWPLGDTPSNGLVRALGLVHIGLAMAGADGQVTPTEVEHVRRHAMDMVSHDAERTRLALRISAFTVEPPDFERLLVRLKTVRLTNKEVIADLLVGVAATDGDISAAEYEALQRAYRAMRLGTAKLDRSLETLRGKVRIADAVGAGHDRRSQLGQDQDAKRFDALRDLLAGPPSRGTAY